MPQTGNPAKRRFPDPGRLRYQLILEAPPDAGMVNTFGEVPDIWTALGTAWCSREPVATTEEFASGQLQTATDYRLWLRWRPGISTELRGQLLGETLSFRSVVEHGPDSDGHWLEILARKQG